MNDLPTTLAGSPASLLADLVARRKASAVEVLEDHLRAIAGRNAEINALCTVDAEGAMDAARRADDALARGEAAGPLHGVPIGIKDVTQTKGLRTTFGSPLFADHVPGEDALVVSRLRAAGGIVLAKTNTPEFAAGANTVNPVFGATVNPRNTKLTVGGSTGGGAAALATGMIALAEGTDYGGSLRVPAAFCGVVGLRPTAGLVPSHPVPDPWDLGRTHGPMARNVDDVALMLSVMAGFSNASPVSTPTRWEDLRESMALSEKKLISHPIAWSPDISGIGLDPAVRDAFGTAIEDLGKRFTLKPSAFDASDGRAAYKTLRGFWMATQYRALLPRLGELSSNLAGNIERGLALDALALSEASAIRARLWEAWQALFAEHAFLITPTVPVEPFPVTDNFPKTVGGTQPGDYVDWIAPTYLVTLMGLPAISVPVGMTASGMPFGLQIIGPRFSEPRLLAFAKAIAAPLSL